MAETIQRSFTSGEIAPALRSRADMVKYTTGLATCENFIVRPQGGVYSRPGTRFVGEVSDSSKVARLIPFQFNTEQAYVLVFEHNIMHVIKDGGFVLDGAGPALFSLVTTYTEAEISRLSFTQSADVMTIAHPSHDPANLSRTDHDAWTLADIDYAPTVTSPTFTADISKIVSAATNASPCQITTTTAHGFTTGRRVSMAEMGGLTTLNGNAYGLTVVDTTNFTLDGTDTSSDGVYSSGGTAVQTTALYTVGSGGGTYSKEYFYVVTAVDANGVESIASAEVSTTVKSLSSTFGVRITWTSVAGTEYYRVYKDPSSGTNVYGWIGDTIVATFVDFNKAPITSDAPPKDRQPFSASGDKPSAVTYYQQRQIFANTTNEPQSVFTTQIANYQSMRASDPVRDDDAITFTIASSQVNEIRHLVAIDALILMTSGGEWRTTEGESQVFTPSTVGARQQTRNGASWVPPVVANDTVIYVQEKGSRVRDLNFSFADDKYTGNDLSIMSEHMFEKMQIVEMAHAAEPYGVLWCVRSDGQMLGLTYQREHQVWGWHRHTTNGSFESITTITEDNRDAVYVVVKRTVNGSTVRYVERMEPRETVEARDCFYVDSGLTLDVPSGITGATQASPVVIASVGHPFSNTDLVDLSDILGMVELNGNQYKVANVAANSYELTNKNDDTDIDGTAFTAYTSGGQAREAVTSISGLTHLEGEAVDVLANGNVVEGLVVTAGAITLPHASSRVHVGLSYLPVIETLDLDAGSATETLKGKQVSVSNVTIEVEKSRGGWVGPIDDDGNASMLEIKPRFDSDGYDQIALKSYKQEINIQPHWSKGGGVRIEQRDPLPLAILAVIPEVDIGGS